MGASESKQVFEKSIDKLMTEDALTMDQTYWNEIWDTIGSKEELSTALTFEKIRILKTTFPNNLGALLNKAVLELYEALATPLSISPEHSLKCIRILSCIMPPLLADHDEQMVFDLFWKVNKPTNANVSVEGEESKNEVKSETETTEEMSFPLGVLIVHGILNLLFSPECSLDFSVTTFLSEDEQKEYQQKNLNNPLEPHIPHCIWAAGIKVNSDEIVMTSSFDANRIEVLQLLLIVLSGPLYRSLENNTIVVDPWYQVVTSMYSPNVTTLFYSLINTVLGYDPYGWGIPYGSVVVNHTHEKLVEVCLQILLILLDWKNPSQENKEPRIDVPSHEVSNEDETQPSVDDQRLANINIFCKIIASISQPKDFDFIFQGFSVSLNNIYQAKNTYLPGSYYQVHWYEGLLVLFWKMLEENVDFMTHILKNCDITKIFVPICYLMFEFRNDPSKVGLIHTCTFILLRLSSERNFGIQLNQPFNTSLPISLPIFTGTHIDLLVIILHKLVVNGQKKLNVLFHCFLTIICNVSPYTRQLSLVSSVKLVNLFELFTSPRFLYAAEANHQYVALLLENFNNIIQYQYERNPQLIYAIIQRKEVFYKLADLTLPMAIQAAAAVTGKNGNKSNILTDNPQPNNNQDRIENSDENANFSDDDKKIEGSDGKFNDSENKLEENQEIPVTRFIPTQEWLNSVKFQLPLTCITKLLQHLLPQVENLINKNGALDELQIVEFIGNTTMVGLLPVPHPIVMRKYQPNQLTSLWFTSYLWGVVFLYSQSSQCFDFNCVKLFTITPVMEEEF